MLATVPGCELEVQRGPDWLLVRVVQLDCDPSQSPSLAEQFWSLLERHLTHRLVLQLDRIGLLDSYVVGQLLQLRRQIDAHGGVMRLCSLSPSNWRTLRTCDPDQMFLPYRTREEAVMGAYRPQKPK